MTGIVFHLPIVSNTPDFKETDELSCEFLSVFSLCVVTCAQDCSMNSADDLSDSFICKENPVCEDKDLFSIHAIFQVVDSCVVLLACIEI